MLKQGQCEFFWVENKRYSVQDPSTLTQKEDLVYYYTKMYEL